MKCLDDEEKNECSQVAKLKLKLICFIFLVGSSWILTCIKLKLICFIFLVGSSWILTCIRAYF